MNIEELKLLAQDVTGWRNCDQAWEEADEDGYRTAVVGAISEDDEKYPVICVDCAQYYADDDSLKVAKFIAAANPATVLELIAMIQRLEAKTHNVKWTPENRATNTPQRCLKRNRILYSIDLYKYRWPRRPLKFL